MTVTLKEEVVEDGYPEDQLEAIISQSQGQYEKQITDHGSGKNWLQDEARYHIWKACDELFQARDYVHNGDYDAAMPHFADALNHMLFSMEICQYVSNDPIGNVREQ